ncbi:hypothetical protein V494_03622 [Pseudogymnoascus sp. VKM F-4513 (FW-928)]|nr:hypothetical protein V494_03622 [Pseudogymnoascus sp. VKM F-4513 (FW-928)]
MTKSSVIKNPQTKFDVFAAFVGDAFEANPAQSFAVAVCLFLLSIAATTWLLVGAFDVVVHQDRSIAKGTDGNGERYEKPEIATEIDRNGKGEQQLGR